MELEDIITAAGGPSALARALGINHSAVLRWKRVPAERLADVSRITGISLEVILSAVRKTSSEEAAA